MDQTDKTEVSIPAPATQLSSGLGSGLGCRLVYTSLPKDTEAGRRTIARAVTADEKILWDAAPCAIDVVDVVILEVEMPDPETGELLQKTRTVCICADGLVWSTNSTSVLSRIQRLAGILGEPPWNPAQRVEFFRQKTRGGNTCLACTIPNGQPESPSQDRSGSSSSPKSSTTGQRKTPRKHDDDSEKSTD